MRETIAENGLQDKVCQQMDMGLLQEVIPASMIEELLETYQMWEERERKTNMVSMVYWLIALHVYPTLSQRRVYGKLVSGRRPIRDDRETFRYSSDDEVSGSPFPQARLLLLVECGTVLHCDVEISSCRQAEARGVRLLLERWSKV